MTKANFFYDLNKNRHFLSNRLCTLLKLVTHLVISELDSRWAEPFEEAALNKLCILLIYQKMADMNINKADCQKFKWKY